MNVKNIKTLAFYLPQFHAVKENDEWWGKGFTEWTTVRKAEPLFLGHDQPREPLDDRYYDLLQKDTLIWQASLAHKYGLDGFVFYHYYFKNGRRILEKPAENLLKWRNIDLPFCFDWANESWVRTWSKFEKSNVWSESEEQSSIKKTRILLQQEYGNKEDWKKHFDYLLPFFLDARYIKIDNKPIFIVYWPSEIEKLSEMKAYWTELAIDAGLSGIYWMGESKDVYIAHHPALDATLIRTPDCSNCHELPPIYKNGVETYDYRDAWHAVSWRDYPDDKKVYLSGCLAYDTTPRRGKKGIVLTDCSPNAFKELLIELYQVSNMRNNDFVFLNAWNEWGEGAYLEPDKKNKYAYLEALKQAKEEFLNGNDLKSVNPVEKIKLLQSSHRYYAQRLKNALQLQEIFHMWLTIHIAKRHISDYLIERGLKKIGIYGYGLLGNMLANDLKNKPQISLEAIIDKSAKNLTASVPLYEKIYETPTLDAIIVTPATLAVSIKEEIQKERFECVFMLEEILRDMCREIECE